MAFADAAVDVADLKTGDSCAATFTGMLASSSPFCYADRCHAQDEDL